MPPLILAALKILAPNTEAKKKLYAFLSVAALVLISFVSGYFSHHPDTVVKTETVTQTVVQYKDRIVTVQAKTQKKKLTEDVQIVKAKDGSEVITKHLTEGDSTKTDTNVTKVASGTDTTKTDTKTSSSTTYSQPNWRLGATLGFSIHDSPLSKTTGIDPGKLIYGGEVDRRIVGPLWGGAWGNTSGQFGIAASLQF